MNHLYKNINKRFNRKKIELMLLTWKRYNEKISESVSNILTNVLGTAKTKDIDSTALPYNFIGNDRKPFYICSWLAGKSVPETGGKKAGYFFFENYDGFKFKAIDIEEAEAFIFIIMFIDLADNIII